MSAGRAASGLLLVLAGALLGVALPAQGQATQSAATLSATDTTPADEMQTARASSVTGTVVDSNGDAIPGAHVVLGIAGTSASLATEADGDGYFSFIDPLAGACTLSVTAPGFAANVQSFRLAAGENLRTADVVLAVSGGSTDVEVSLTLHDQAAEEMHIEEKQRLVGFIPNFYVTYNWKAPPMSAGQKFHLALRSIVDPANIALTAGIAGVEQWTNAFSGYGPGWTGYGKRFGAGMGDLAVGNLVGGAILPSLLRQDPRYFYKGTGSVWSRALYAVSTAVICRGDNGKWQPNYSSVAGDVAAGAISNTYYPKSDRSTAVVTVETGLLNAAEDGFGNLLQEFVFKRFTPSAKQPKP